MSATRDQPHRHLVTAEEYLRMGEAGVFAPDARLELIEGEIIEMAPIHPAHASTVAWLTRLFVLKAGEEAIVSPGNPAVISARSVPQPDLMLLRPRRDYYRRRHPSGDDLLLAVEVSDTTLRFDLRTKAPMYARSLVRELWVVDVNAMAVHVFRGPAEGGYRTSLVARGDAALACEALPQVALRVEELFPGQAG